MFKWGLPYLSGLLALLVLSGCATPPPTPTPTPPPQARYQPEEDGGQFCPPPRAWYEHIIQPGDTIRSLAERTSSSMSQLAAANCLHNPTILPVGMRFYVPRRIND